MNKQYRRVLTIAGSDSGGGAGIQADIKTISACGCYAMTAITVITIQNTTGVDAVFPIPLAAISGQITAVLDDIGADAIKIGMLDSSEVIKTVRNTLDKYNFKNIVLDPVMVATSGDKLLRDDAIETLKEEIIPIARIITPNIPEAEILLGEKVQSQEKLVAMAEKLSIVHGVSVLLKAGHFNSNELTDILYNIEDGTVLKLTSARVDTKNTHGTGCTLSSAIASFLAHGLPLNEAVRQAKDYTARTISSGQGYVLGAGHGPVHHFEKYWE